MAALPIEAEVVDLIARERGLPRRKVTLSSRLLQDLGMDGDDAVEFFKTSRNDMALISRPCTSIGIGTSAPKASAAR